MSVTSSMRHLNFLLIFMFNCFLVFFYVRLWLCCVRLWLCCVRLWLCCVRLWLCCVRLWLCCVRLWLCCAFFIWRDAFKYSLIFLMYKYFFCFIFFLSFTLLPHEGKNLRDFSEENFMEKRSMSCDVHREQMQH